MAYNLNLGEWESVFAVPSKIFDKYIKSSSEAQIKVLLCVLRYGGRQLELTEIAKITGLSEEETQNSIIYWDEQGLLSSKIEENFKVEEILNKNKIFAYENSQKITRRYQKPDSSHIANRMQSSDEINFLMQEAQIVLGRPISNGDSAALLMLHDNDGLPVDVIIMLLQYAVSVGKANMKYIEKIGINWSSEGIDDLEKAEKKIQSLNEANVMWNRFESIIGIYHRAPSVREEEAVCRWLGQWGYSDELVKEAYERCINANGKYVLKYMDSIVKRWYSQGIVTIEQALIENSARSRKKNFSDQNNKASYNIDEYENYFRDYIKDYVKD